jgi:hypothetical protein
MAGKVQGDKDFRTLPARILIFCNNLFFMLEINSKKWMKKNENCIFLESDHEGAFVAL